MIDFSRPYCLSGVSSGRCRRVPRGTVSPSEAQHQESEQAASLSLCDEAHGSIHQSMPGSAEKVCRQTEYLEVGLVVVVGCGVGLSLRPGQTEAHGYYFKAK